MSFEEIFKTIPAKNLKAKKEEIRDAIVANLSPVQIYLIGQLLDSVEFLTSQIALIDQQIQALVLRRNEDLKIAMSIPGMGSVSASTILAEIGDFNDFKTGDQLVSYCGLVPSVYQSAGS